MKKGVLVMLLLVLLISFSYALVPDSDFDGVPDENDQCPNSDTTDVDQFGCGCAQKNCASDNNECTDDCSVINGLPSCAFANNDKKCQGGYCTEGECKGLITIRGKYISFVNFPGWFFSESDILPQSVVNLVDKAYVLEGQLNNGLYPTPRRLVTSTSSLSFEYEESVYGVNGFPLKLGRVASPSNNGGDHSWDVMFHEMAHNFWNANSFFYTLAAPGPFLQESTAVLTAEYVYLNLIRDSTIPVEIIRSLDSVFGAERDYQKGRYEQYIDLGKPYSQDESGPNYAILTSQAFNYEMFLIGDEFGWDNYPKFNSAFSESLKQKFDFWQDGVSDTEETTYAIAALSYAFNYDFRERFKRINFPLDDNLFDKIIEVLNGKIRMEDEGASSGMSPSGIVQSTGNQIYVTLRWQAFADATHYNVRLDDGTADRYDDLRFTTCPNSPHYYCENGIKETFIERVSVKPGRKYIFWVDPIISGRDYFNINTAFTVSSYDGITLSNLNEDIDGNNISIVSDDFIISGDFIITQLASVSPKENQGSQSTLVIIASIGNKLAPVDVETARNMVLGMDYGTVNDFYIKNSFGQAYLTGEVAGQYELPASVCETDDILNAALKATDPFVNFNDYSRIILFTTKTNCVSFDGLGTIGKTELSTKDGRIKASVSWNFVSEVAVAAHELGHNFGLWHANTQNCPSCVNPEYGDIFSVMGARVMHHLNVAHKEYAGWLDKGLITKEGEYLIKPLEAEYSYGSVQQIKLPIEGGYYSLSFRQPLDYDAGMPSKAYSGVFIHLIQPGYDSRTVLINYDGYELTPNLQIGRSFRDTTNNYEIVLNRADAEGALVSISAVPEDALGCTDSDGGLNYYLKGTIQGRKSTYSVEDCCSSKPNILQCTDEPTRQLTEFYCNFDSSIGYVAYICGTLCVNGACANNDKKPPKDICDPYTQPPPDWGIKNGQCLRSCGAIDGTYCEDGISCPEGYKLAGDSYDCNTCCKEADSQSLQTITGEITASGSELKGENIIEVEGELEVLHVDDFDHPENSKYIFYINLDGKKYEIKSENRLPVVMSGTKVKIRGIIVEGKFYLENYITAHPEVLTAKEATNKKQELVTQEKPLGIKWPYIAVPLILIFAFLGLLEISRLRGHKQLNKQRIEHKNLALRNYVTANLRKGYTKEQIRNALAKENYSNREIEEAFFDV